MIEDHEVIEELLAGYVLRSLTGEDARDADRLLSEHVPSCARCRGTLSAFRDTAADLALDATPLTPPETLLPRLHREMGERRLRGRGSRASFAVAAGFVAVVGMAGLSVSQGIRASNAQSRADLMQGMADIAGRPGASRVTLAASSATDSAPITELSAPGETVVYLYGHDVPAPSAGMIYRIWEGSNGSYALIGEFVPESDMTVIKLEIEGGVDQLLITQEPAGSSSQSPSESDIVWSAAA